MSENTQAKDPSDKSKDTAPVPAAPAAPEAQPGAGMDEQVSQAFVTHVRAVLAGQAQPKNKESAYLIDQLRQQTAQTEAAGREYQGTQEQAVRLKTRIDQLQGATSMLLTLLKKSEGDI